MPSFPQIRRATLFICMTGAMLTLFPLARAEPRVLIVSVDGLRPDLALRANCPTLRSLMMRGSFTFWAQTTPAGKTLPSHTSMLTGREIEDHGISWNTKPPEGINYLYAKTPTIFALAKKAHISTAMIAGKEKFIPLAEPGTIDHAFVAEGTLRDKDTTGEAIRIIKEAAPRLIFLHLPDTDSTGHSRGWGTPQQIATIENADQCIGRVLDALQTRGVLGETLVIVTADHGGWMKNHNGHDTRGSTIPWIACGPGVNANFDLTLVDNLQIRIEDTFATACAFAGIPLPEECDGKPVTAIFTAPTETEPVSGQ